MADELKIIPFANRTPFREKAPFSAPFPSMGEVGDKNAYVGIRLASPLLYPVDFFDMRNRFSLIGRPDYEAAIPFPKKKVLLEAFNVIENKLLTPDEAANISQSEILRTKGISPFVVSFLLASHFSTVFYKGTKRSFQIHDGFKTVEGYQGSSTPIETPIFIAKAVLPFKVACQMLAQSGSNGGNLVARMAKCFQDEDWLPTEKVASAYDDYPIIWGIDNRFYMADRGDYVVSGHTAKVVYRFQGLDAQNVPLNAFYQDENKEPTCVPGWPDRYRYGWPQGPHIKTLRALENK